MFEELCKIVEDESFWETLVCPFPDIKVLRHYTKKFVDRVKFVVEKKHIIPSRVDSVARQEALKSFRKFCTMYYNIKYYSLDDQADEGEHLLNVSESYEYIAGKMGVSHEKLQDIRLKIDEECVKILFGEV